MYNKLAYVMSAFVFLVGMVKLVIVLRARACFIGLGNCIGLDSSMEVLNLAVLIAITVIWAPSGMQRLVHSLQLTMDEDSDVIENIEMVMENRDDEDHKRETINER